MDPAVKRRDDEKEEEAGVTKIKRGRGNIIKDGKTLDSGKPE